MVNREPGASVKCILRAPAGEKDNLTRDQVDRYLSLLSKRDADVLQSLAFNEDARNAFRAADAGRLDTVALTLAVQGSLKSLPQLQKAIGEELAGGIAIVHALTAFHGALGGPGGIAEADFPAFVLFCLAYRMHCYFETSLLPREPRPGSSGGPRVVFVIGGPGAGKGTQCTRIAEVYGYKHLSTGDLLRMERQQQGSLHAQLIESHIRAGTLVPTELVVTLLQKAMRQHDWERGKFLVDGFPRSFENMKVWDKVLGSKVNVRFALFFHCSEACMEARLLERGKTLGRSDDNVESIRHRFRTFQEESAPVADRLESQGLLRRVNAEQSREAVWQCVQAAFGPSIVFVLGGPGAGKDTQCANIAAAFGYQHLRVADILREDRGASRSEAAVPAGAAVGLLLEAMERGGREDGKYLIDGFPRNLGDLEAWHEVIGQKALVKFCFYLEVCEGVMETRMLEQSSDRSADMLESIRQNYINFHKGALPVVEKFKDDGWLKRIDGEQSPEDVWRDIRAVFGPSIIFVMGGPGAGKGTQCTRIAKTFGYTHLSAGDLLREERKRLGSKNGEMIESCIKEGKLVPAEVTLELIKEAMEKKGWEGGKYLIDGFPRSTDNLMAWKKLLDGTVRVQFCLFFDASETAMEARLVERGKTSGRADDNPETIRKRFAVFQKESIPVIEGFSSQGILQRVDADKGPEEVWANVQRLFAPTVVLVIGGPGAGKGTQCSKVSVPFGFQHLSIGDLLRGELKRPESLFGVLIEHHLKNGTLVPEKIVLGLLQQAMEVRGWAGGRYLIDGFPRSSNNWDAWKSDLGSKVNLRAVLYLDCSESTRETRLLQYGKTSGRPDDHPESIRMRLDNFRNEVPSVVEALKEEGLLRIIDAEQDIEEVSNCISEVLQTELKPHLRNQAVVLIKPHALNKETSRFVQSYLTTHGIDVLCKEVVSVEEALRKDLFTAQYFQILGNAEADPKTLFVGQEAQERFKQLNGVSWAEAVAEGKVLSASGGMQHLGLSSEQLFEQSRNTAALQLTRSIGITCTASSNGAAFFVVNAFVPHWRKNFFRGANALMWFMVEFDPARLSWKKFRSEVLGTTDPARAHVHSIRGQMWEHWQALGLSDRPTALNNCIHASAGPLEALHERLTWTGSHLTDDALGRLLLSSGVPEEVIQAWLRNMHVENWMLGREAYTGPIFDCTKACDTSTFHESALRYLKDNNSKFDFWTVSPKTARPCLLRGKDGSRSQVLPSRSDELPKVMTILHFNDVYNVEPRAKDPVGGIARFVTKVQELRAEAASRGEAEPVVLFSGDAFNPSITSTTTRGKHMVPALNKIGIDTACFGNHDFDFGIDHLIDLSTQTNFPWLLSNVFDKRTGRPLAHGTAMRIMEFHGRRIGLLGLVEKEWLVTLGAVDPDDVDYEDFCPCAQRLARQMKEKQGAEIVIALTHMRMPNDFLLAHEVAEVDIILGGHDHHYEVHPEGPHGTYVLNSGTDFRDLTELRLEFTDGPGPRPFKVLSTRHIEINSSIRENPEMKSLVDKCQGEVHEMMEVVLGDTAVDLDCRFASIRTQETNIGNFVADVMRNALKTDLAVLNSGTLRADTIIEKGPFKMRDLVSLLPMLDELCILQLSGEKLMSVLENSVSQYPRLEGRFAQVSGVTFTFDAAGSPGARILRETVKIGGAQLDLGRNYKLCTKDYLRQGKDGYDVFREAVCLADGEQAGILPTVVHDAFKEISTLNGFRKKACHKTTQNAEKALGQLALSRVGDGPDLLKRYAIEPKVEGRIVCLNPIGG